MLLLKITPMTTTTRKNDTTPKSLGKYKITWRAMKQMTSPCKAGEKSWSTGGESSKTNAVQTGATSRISFLLYLLTLLALSVRGAWSVLGGGREHFNGGLKGVVTCRRREHFDKRIWTLHSFRRGCLHWTDTLALLDQHSLLLALEPGLWQTQGSLEVAQALCNLRDQVWENKRQGASQPVLWCRCHRWRL